MKNVFLCVCVFLCNIIFLHAQNQSTETPALQNTFEINEMIDAQSERQRLNTRYLLCDFSPTGFYAFANTTLIVRVEKLSGDRLPHLLIGTYGRHKQNGVTNIPLVEGKNEIAVTNEGMLWLRYTNKDPHSSARIVFESGYEIVPHFVMGKTTPQAWKNMLRTYSKSPDVLLEGGKCMMVLSLDNALKYAHENQDQILEWLNKVVAIEDNIAGLDGSSPEDIPNAHHYLLTQHDKEDVYFFATNYITAFSTKGLRYIATLEGIKEGGWGCWHEIGHLHQQTWTWSKVSETTVNIFTMAVERQFIPERNQRRLIKDAVWEKTMRYLAYPDVDKDYNDGGLQGVSSYRHPQQDVFQRLCMFEQLYLAFGESFYQNLSKRTRKESPVFDKNDDDAKITYFVLTACKVSGKRLDSFFKKWGIRLSSPAQTEQLYADIASLNLPLPDMDISKMSD